MRLYITRWNTYVNLEVEVARSAVDSFIQSGIHEEGERELTEDELDFLNQYCVAEIQEYAWANGSRNHN